MIALHRILAAALLPVLLASACVSSGYLPVSAGPSLTINQVDGSRFPRTTTYVTALDTRGYPLLGLSLDHFQITEDGVPVTMLDVASGVNTQEPLATVLTIDVSGSMNENALAQEKAAAIAFINELRPQDQAAVIAFSSQVQTAIEFTTDREALIETINALRPGGNTALYDALFDSVDLTSRAPAQRRVVILMTDGMNTQSQASLEDGLKLAAKEGVGVYTVGLGQELDRDVLSRIARETGARGLIAPSPEDLRSAYERIGTELRNQYLLTYTSPRPRGARDYRVQVRMSAEGSNVRAESTYRPAPQPPTISTVSLKEGETLGEPATVLVEASSSVPIASVRLSVDGRMHSEATIAPYRLALDPGRLSPGRHQVTVSVQDAAGSEVTHELNTLVPLNGEGVPGPAAAAGTMADQSLDPPAAASGELAARIGGVVAGPLAGVASFADQWGTNAASLVSAGTEAMNSSLDRARTATSNAWNGAVDLAASAIPRLPPVGLSLAATLAGLYEARRLLAGLRAGLAQVTCPSCSIQFRHYQEDCPACLRREQLRDLEQRGLEEVLVQNNLLDEEALAEAVLHSRNEGKALEEVLLERGLVSPASLNQARYYLARAPGMGVRAKDLLGERAAKRRWPVAPQALMVRGGALLLMGTTLALTLPRLLS